MSEHTEQPSSPIQLSSAPITALSSRSEFDGLPAGPFFDGFEAEQAGPAAAPLRLTSLLRRKRLMVCIFCLVVGIGVPLVWAFVTPLYRANAVIRIRPVLQQILYRVEENAQIPNYDAYVSTQVGILLAPSNLSRVVDQPEIRATEWYNSKPMSLASLLASAPDPIDRLLEELQVQPRPRTELIDVSMETTKSADAALIVNAVVEEYLKESRSEMNKATGDRLKELTTIRERLQAQVQSAYDDRFRILSEAGSGLSDEARLGRLTERIDELHLELERKQMAQRVLNYRIERLRASLSPGGEGEGATDPSHELERPQLEFYGDSVWTHLNTERNALQDRLDQMRGRLGAQHPEIDALEVRIRQLSARLASREEQLLSSPMIADMRSGLAPAENPAAQLVAFEAEAVLATKEIEELQKMYEKQLDQLRNAGEDAHVFVLATETLNYKKSELAIVQERIKSITTEMDAPRNRITRVSEARAASTPQRDRRIVLTFMVIAAGFMLAMGAGYWRAVADSAIYEADDLIQITRAPFLGQLPQMRSLLPAAADASAEPILFENMRMLRTALLQRLPAGSSVSITSPEPNAGKTSVALLLATSLGRLGKNVLLVDADVRQRALSAVCDAGDRPGLCDVLSGRTVERSAIVSVSTDNLVLLPAGSASPDRLYDQELLANGVFASWLRRWKKQYDYVVLDTPPTLLAADARILAGQSDGTILVLRSSCSSRPNAVEALAGLAASGAKLLGTVLTGVESRHPAYEYAADNGHSTNGNGNGVPA